MDKVCVCVAQVTESGVNRGCWGGCWRWRRWEKAVTSGPCKHMQSPVTDGSFITDRLFSPPIRGWTTAEDTPSQPDAADDWIRGSRPRPVRFWDLPWQQRQWSPWERSQRKGRRFLMWENASANQRRRGRSFRRGCQVKSEWYSFYIRSIFTSHNKCL